ncbi:MAG: hypothetical protein IRY89_02560 [Pseudolabrys sp.]|nr:hypothetical protein [Pseudolabrys sp.]
MMRYLRLPAFVAFAVLVLSAGAEAHGCRGAGIRPLWREIPAEQIAPNVYIVHAPAGPRRFPYAGRRAYQPPWWTRYWSW